MPHTDHSHWNAETGRWEGFIPPYDVEPNDEDEEPADPYEYAERNLRGE